MAVAMATAAAAGCLLHLRALPSSGLASPLPAPSHTLPPSNCSTRSATSFIVSGEPRTVRGARRVATLRAAGSELAAPSPVEEEDGPNLPCGTCNSKGWLVCDFCKGQKTNVQVRANKFYRRCPSCRAVGVVICPQCKVFKCVTFPDGVDGY